MCDDLSYAPVARRVLLILVTCCNTDAALCDGASPSNRHDAHDATGFCSCAATPTATESSHPQLRAKSNDDTVASSTGASPWPTIRNFCHGIASATSATSAHQRAHKPTTKARDSATQAPSTIHRPPPASQTRQFASSVSRASHFVPTSPIPFAHSGAGRGVSTEMLREHISKYRRLVRGVLESDGVSRTVPRRATRIQAMKPRAAEGSMDGDSAES
ncbi:hypothetical protein BU26DRAFT_556034 [Trematosphaeria pertusa]|uniref:Uncharacterized protein n=1 Tax=Trematosphaeria pertusa TaxID=390896 RepID=A0A6A6HTN0_9PLEO|nr:uncharacterized protein BU26DRAFT_556034 [Trematosphaeria pertusa]KAF2241525.1 hypothetical protein BU26DRAFT_556034 [Trematosphaeria pertusa]